MQDDRCPGRGSTAGFWRYRYPVEVNVLGTGKKWAVATKEQIAEGRWRCGACVHLAAKEQRPK